MLSVIDSSEGWYAPKYRRSIRRIAVTYRSRDWYVDSFIFLRRILVALFANVMPFASSRNHRLAKALEGIQPTVVVWAGCVDMTVVVRTGPGATEVEVIVSPGKLVVIVYV